MNKFFAITMFLLLTAGLFAQEDAPQKYALVIGNGNYTSLSRLANPVNDANDITASLESLGFTVDKLLNASQSQMDEAVIRLRNRLSASGGSYGFFFYAGHGVQSGGENYLIPVDANIPDENFLRSRAVSVQTVLDVLNDARNVLNVVVLDACRDNPFGWNRGGSRGLQVVHQQPAESIIVYATSAGQTAADGEGRNGLFTSQLLPNLATPGLDVNEVFRRTGADVSEASGRQQIPAIYNQFFGTAYLGEQGEMQDRLATLPLHSMDAGRHRKTFDPSQLWSLGASAGTAFFAPWFIGTLRGTLAPFKNTFLEIGFDYGMISNKTNTGYEVDSYYSLYPYIHYAYFMPFGVSGGWYAGAGSGYMIPHYVFSDGRVSDSEIYTFTANVFAGVNIGNFLDVSYTLRTNFSGVSHKLSVGYVYRFK